ncbi:MAG: class I SAM-dependent methyltransferase [Candidatus Contendobacter sp.]|nr:class I SAM-dependent methyltransferase [Candidatus Contendobacter sp.]
MNHFRLPRLLVNRENYILAAARDKTVLHLGCADYPFTEERIINGSWLHSKISKVAKYCVGLELNSEMVSILRDRYKIENVIQGDAEQLDMLALQKFDVIVAGELIEHLNNPGLFLKSAQYVLAPEGKLIITTTNAFCLRRFIRIPFGVESIHPDHTYYFSHSTLHTLVNRFGYLQIDAMSYSLPNRKPLIPYIFERAAVCISPNFGEGLIHCYRLKDNQG